MISRKRISVCLAFLLLVSCSTAIVLSMSARGFLPSGFDIWGHIYKGNFMYENLREGNLYPLYSPDWYNGFQIFRYWPPLSYYLFAGLEVLARQDVIQAYDLFVGCVFLIGGVGWLLWGAHTGRVWLCTFLGVIWFFLPDMIRNCLLEGNVPRMLSAALIPFLLFYLYLYVFEGRRKALCGVSLFMCLMIMTHLMIAAMMGISAFLFFVFHFIGTREWKRPLTALAVMLSAFGVCGLWVVPALFGGILGMNEDAGSQAMRELSFPLSQLLDAGRRMAGRGSEYYFGLGTAGAALIGCLAAGRRSRAGFLTLMAIICMTTPAAAAFLSRLPLGQVLWMSRFSVFAYGFCFLGLIVWKQCRIPAAAALSALLLFDAAPALSLDLYYREVSKPVQEDVEWMKDTTVQRTALMDLSSLSCYPSWGLTEGEEGVDYTYGWAWQGAATSGNIMMLNTALEEQRYEYLFDRLLELGNDTAAVRRSLVPEAAKERLFQAAQARGYQPDGMTEETYLFRYPVKDSFGVKTGYRGIAIGRTAPLITLDYPVITEGNSIYLDDYSVEELSAYDVVFANGFEYRSRRSAEQLVRDLGRRGVRVVVDMSWVPVDNVTGSHSFLGITAQQLRFGSRKEPPVLTYRDMDPVKLEPSKEYEPWYSRYLTGLSRVDGIASMDGMEFPFAGYGEEENVLFVGLGIPYHQFLDPQPEKERIVADLLKLTPGEMPERTLVPVTIEQERNRLIIRTEQDGVNTTLAYHDNFVSDSPIGSQNHLLLVDNGTTVVDIRYPYAAAGCLVTMWGILGTAVSWYYSGADGRKRNR